MPYSDTEIYVSACKRGVQASIITDEDLVNAVESRDLIVLF